MGLVELNLLQRNLHEYARSDLTYPLPKISSISDSDYVRITLILSQYLLLAKKSFKFPQQKKSKFGKINF